ncbi:MAG: hybrid sensor histidine kinase/response regulator, partial [Caulobacteraceae bacterium]
MTDQPPKTGAVHHVSFQARVAGVALITTVVVLVAACLTFMLQQWAVAREQNHQAHVALSSITAGASASALAAKDLGAARASIATLSNDSSVTEARLNDASGRAVSVYARPEPANAEALDTIKTPVMSDGTQVGELSMTFETPTLTALLPQFVALTGALFFGGVGVALFLARGLASRVIAPVLKLSEAMNDVAASGSFAPVEVEADDPLFRSLTASFNHLLANLDEREQALQRSLRELVEARDAANAANVLKSQFLANMSHEIRTPLNGVLAMAEVMSMSDLAPVQRERLDVIRQSGGLLLAVLNDVLDLSKIEARPFDLRAELGDLLEVFRGQALAKGLDFPIAYGDAAQGQFVGDAVRLKQVVGNLLSNAVKFTAEGQVSISITLDEPPVGPACLLLEVRDTGVGFPPDFAAALFQRFRQAGSSRFGGAGLGLSITRALVEMMGGEIEAAST